MREALGSYTLFLSLSSDTAQPHIVPLSPLSTRVVPSSDARVALSHAALDRRQVATGIEESAWFYPIDVHPT